MCWSGEASAALAVIGFTSTGYLLYKGESKALAAGMGYFTLMEALQAYTYSVVAVAWPSLFPASFRNVHGEVAVYFEAAVVIIALVFVGQVLELRARERTGDAIRALLDLAPKTARRDVLDPRNPPCWRCGRSWPTTSPEQRPRLPAPRGCSLTAFRWARRLCSPPTNKAPSNCRNSPAE